MDELREIPEELMPILRRLENLDRILEENWYERTKSIKGEDLLRKINKYERLLDPYGGGINDIPCGVPGPCCKFLVVFIGNNTFESVEKRILQAVEHCTAICTNITRYVIFYVLKWDSWIWERHKFSF